MDVPSGWITHAFRVVFKFLRTEGLYVWWEHPPATGDERRVPGVKGPDSRGSGIESSSSHLETSHVSKIQSSWTAAPPQPTAWRWYHVQVRNRGRDPAVETRGYIAQLLVQESDGNFKLHTEWKGRLPLQWANSDFSQTMTIVRRPKDGPWDRLDIFRAANTLATFQLVTPTPLVGLPTTLHAGKVYRIRVVVESQTASATACTLEVKLGRDWDDVTVQQIPKASFREALG